MKPNGPAIWGGCVTLRKHRVGSWYFSREALSGAKGHGASLACRQAGRVWRTFCRHGTIFIEHYACRAAPRASKASDGGTSLIGAANLSPITKLVAGTGAVSRYKLSRSQKFITVQDFSYVHMRALPNVA
jgi:hypothetical protein